MTDYKRFGNRWTINECLQLEREFDLLALSIDEMAERHKRTPNAIMLKLDSEGHADYCVLYSNYKICKQQEEDEQEQEEEDEPEDEEQEDEEEEDEQISLQLQVLNLEKKVNQLTDLLMKQNKNTSGFSLF
jgi:Ran GTPase-activating protein (RanGAP) involved in mRNA processing and transport